MPTNSLSDLEKIQQSLSSITSIASFDDVLATFGLLDMPTAQKYGILFGCVLLRGYLVSFRIGRLDFWIALARVPHRRSDGIRLLLPILRFLA